MYLSNLIIETRLRNAWSSIDLGVLFARQFWWRSVALYLAVAIPIFLLTRLLTDFDTVLSFIVLWWFKPLYERPILYMMSRELFDDKTGFLRTIRNYRDWLFPGTLAILTMRRISFARSMYAPITLLERPSPAVYRARSSVLGNKYSSEGLCLTLILFFTEIVFILSTLAVLGLIFPDRIEIPLLWFFDLVNVLVWLGDLERNSEIIVSIFILVKAAIAPFYTAAGFMLYISRRVELEGWDIEICFRDWMRGYRRPMGGSE